MMRTRRKRIKNTIGNKDDKKSGNGTIWPQSQFYPQPHFFKMMRTRRKRINNRIGNKGDKKKVENGTTWSQTQFYPEPHFFKMKMRGQSKESANCLTALNSD